MGKCYIKECYSVPEIGSYYCTKHREDIIKDFKKRLQNTLLIEEKEKLK